MEPDLRLRYLTSMKNLRRAFTLSLCLLLASCAIPAANASAYNAKPKLVVILVLDQFRGDYLPRYQADFKTPNGFNLFLKRGASFDDCYFDYANTMTAPGHSTIATGAYTDGHGIAENDWWDLSRSTTHTFSSVDDENYQLVGVPADGAGEMAQEQRMGASPRNLLASTLGDEVVLATKGESKLYGISLKDRAAILTSGHASNGAFWIDQKSGRFITSTYWMSTLPAWASSFDEGGRIAETYKEAGVPATASFYSKVGPTPAAVSYELDFAKALIQNEKLGRHDVTDVLTISISSTDMLGHAVGPDSPRQRAMIDAVDVDLNNFFGWLDKNVDGGLPNVWVALTGDHGVAPSPYAAAKLGMPSAALDMSSVYAALDAALNQRFTPGQKIAYMLRGGELPYLEIDPRPFERAHVSEADAEQAVAEALGPALATTTMPVPQGPRGSRLPQQPLLRHAYTKVQVAAGDVPRTEFGRLLLHSYSTNGGWWVFANFGMYELQGSKAGGTTHFSPYSYDRHVPLAFFGAPFAPGTYHGRVEPVDIAATLASLLGINQPSASIGRVLTQAVKPGWADAAAKSGPAAASNRSSKVASK